MQTLASSARVSPEISLALVPRLRFPRYGCGGTRLAGVGASTAASFETARLDLYGHRPCGGLGSPRIISSWVGMRSDFPEFALLRFRILSQRGGRGSIGYPVSCSMATASLPLAPDRRRGWSCPLRPSPPPCLE